MVRGVDAVSNTAVQKTMQGELNKQMFHWEYKLCQLSPIDKKTVIWVHELKQECSQHSPRYINLIFGGNTNNNVQDNDDITFDTTSDQLRYFRLEIVDKQSSVQISGDEFSLSFDGHDFSISQHTVGRTKLIWCFVDPDTGNIHCDYEVRDMPSGIYRSDGTFESLSLKQDDEGFKLAKQKLNNVRVQYLPINEYYSLFMDEDGIRKHLPCNQTFANFTGDVAVVK